MRASSATDGARPPRDPLERHSTQRIQPDALALQQELLGELSTRHRSPADPTSGIHDPMPGNSGCSRERVEGIADLAGMPGQPRERSDLSVGRYSSSRYPANHLIDPPVGAGCQASGAALHAAGEHDHTGDDGQSTDPCGYGVPFLD